MLAKTRVRDWGIQFFPSSYVPNKFIQNIEEIFIPIGMCEAEALCINSETQELLLLEHEVPNLICCKAAKTQESFIDALTLLEKYFDRCDESEYYNNDLNIAANVRAECAKLAGGKEYNSFFCGIFGA